LIAKLTLISCAVFGQRDPTSAGDGHLRSWFFTRIHHENTMTRTLLTALILTTLTLTACGQDVGEGGCTVDADCSVGDVCTQTTGECSPAPAGSCANAAECAEGERCEGASASTRGMCVMPAPSCADQADPNAFCAAKAPNTICDMTARVCVRDPNAPACVTSADCGADKVCTTLGGAAQCVSADCSLQPAIFCNNVQAGTVCDMATKRCVMGASSGEPTYVMILDVSSGPASCESFTAEGLRDAGADITSIELADPFGDPLAYGRAVSYTQGTGQVDAGDMSVFDGTPRDLDQRGCPTDGFTQGSVVSLGCGGALFVDFIVGANRPLELRSDMLITVGEYAPVCRDPNASPVGSDKYVVYLCDVPAGEQPTAANCATALDSPKGGDSFWRIP
jgi:hypothetical protein